MFNCEIVYLAQFSTDFHNLGLKIQVRVSFIQNRKEKKITMTILFETPGSCYFKDGLKM